MDHVFYPNPSSQSVPGSTPSLVCTPSLVLTPLVNPFPFLHKEHWLRAPPYVSPFCPLGGGLESVTCHFGDPNGPRPPPPSGLRTGAKAPPSSALRSGAASVCLLSMTFLLGASRLALFTFEIHASIRWNWDPSSAWVASVSGVD